MSKCSTLTDIMYESRAASKKVDIYWNAMMTVRILAFIRESRGCECSIVESFEINLRLE